MQLSTKRGRRRQADERRRPPGSVAPGRRGPGAGAGEGPPSGRGSAPGLP